MRDFCCSNHEMEQLEIEYATYLRNKKILDLLPNVDQDKYKDIVERWYLSYTNKQYADADDEFVKSFKSMKIDADPYTILDSIKDILEEKIVRTSVELEIDELDHLVQYKIGEVSFTIEQKREDVLRSAYKDHVPNASDDAADVHIATCMLRYLSFFSNFRQFSAPLEIYKKAYADGYDIEGMASAFNSQLLLVGGTEFCSLFPDVEADFGSVGSFFDYNFADRRCVVHPPRIEKLVEKTIKFCARQLRTRQCAFRLIVYYQNDVNLMKKYAGRYMRSIEIRSTMSENPFEGTTKSAPFKTYVVELSSFMGEYPQPSSSSE